LIFGNEVNGVSDEVMDLVDACIEIPQFGTKHSFNVSVTAAIVLYHFHTRFKKNI
jgi:tRNA G18 (ribose-2'-O)-methylase SpoU